MCRVVRRSKEALPSGRSAVSPRRRFTLGKVEAVDAETAIRTAIKRYDIKPEHQDRLAARRIVTAE